ncbi:multidrug resistance protein, MATE family [Angomonas deanei]|uniref:MatE, putative n=1 Tax=Angomonas deanei TaxID=59799 RepID=S9W0D5_9TRYP|nr:multidrug resistance protein, MATE family [Angomonas deanei]EPY34856.1 multidrug resistance protein, MATE family [Angomonas deanei]CAD2216675.1 MatE, putative [Angomonas deanei]|eukprot:EPY32931.1 multidrug resistance protein, MATE family [Angomonas deanei]
MLHSATASEIEEEVGNMSFTSCLSVGLTQGAAANVDSIAHAMNEEYLEANRTTANSEVSSEMESEMMLDEDVKSIVKRFIVTGYPLSLSTLAQFSLNTVIIAVVGGMLGEAELGGASLALGLINATGFAFGAGLCGALETVLSHAFGSHKRNLENQQKKRLFYLQRHPGEEVPEVEEQPLYIYGIYAQRMMLILLVTAIPLGLILAFTPDAMGLMNANPLAVHATGQFCRIALYGIPPTLYYQLIQRYYSCQHITVPLSIAMVCAAILNPILQISFISAFGFYGSPLAWLTLMILICLGLTFYLYHSGLYKRTWGGWSKKGTQNVGGLLAIALPSMGVMMSEWVALEVNALAGAFAETTPLAAYSITLQVFGIMWGIGSGVMILACVFVGNALGSGNPLLARKIAFVAIGVMFCVALIDVLIVFALSPIIPKLFSKSEEVASIYRRLMYVVMPYHIFDTFQSTVMGILRGCGLQKLGAAIICSAFCVVGVPLSFLLFFHFEIGVIALWIGPFVGVVVVGVPLYIYILLYYIDWEGLKAVEEEVPDEAEVESPSSPTTGVAPPSGGNAKVKGVEEDTKWDSVEFLTPP